MDGGGGSELSGGQCEEWAALEGRGRNVPPPPFPGVSLGSSRLFLKNLCFLCMKTIGDLLPDFLVLRISGN